MRPLATAPTLVEQVHEAILAEIAAGTLAPGERVSQEQIATLGYVDTLAEQALLEQMLDDVKPPYRADTDGLHYLLKTPFRYPPLKWGSRFGRIHEPGIFYGGCSTEATLAEAAYYRFVFWYSMDGEPVKETISTSGWAARASPTTGP